MGGIAVVMLLLGGETALQGLQSLVIITAVPFAVVMLLIIVAWLRELRSDPSRCASSTPRLRSTTPSWTAWTGSTTTSACRWSAPNRARVPAPWSTRPTASSPTGTSAPTRTENPSGTTSGPESGLTAGTPRRERSRLSPSRSTMRISPARPTGPRAPTVQERPRTHRHSLSAPRPAPPSPTSHHPATRRERHSP
ncbi:BCCT family transporter [Brachybacterium sp. Z12]|uniref:BCCT family transporter n=1 Tax=Brachybacterium sp. Z12 TaxID=2759167 RepID=UPI00223A7B73|nr:BCCT family transporter [Brachybacterium sp. Z12]